MAAQCSKLAPRPPSVGQVMVSLDFSFALSEEYGAVGKDSEEGATRADSPRDRPWSTWPAGRWLVTDVLWKERGWMDGSVGYGFLSGSRPSRFPAILRYSLRKNG